MTAPASVAMTVPNPDPHIAPGQHPGGPRQPIPAGLWRGAEVIDTIVDRHCPQADIRRDLIKRIFETLWDGIDFTEALPTGPCLFLTNRQTSLDALLLGYVISAARAETVNVAGLERATHTHGGALLARCDVRDEPETYRLNRHVRPHHADLRHRAPMVIAALQAGLTDADEPASAVVAAEGPRQNSDGQPIGDISARCIDMARAARVPIVPIRVMWGLPRAPLACRRVWPETFAPQRFCVGAPITAAALDGLPARERADLVCQRINALWQPAPAGHLGSNSALAGRVDRIMAMTGMSQTNALMCDLLLSARPDALSAEGRTVRAWLCDIGTAMQHKASDWLYHFAMWLSDGFSIAHTGVREQYADLPRAR